MPENKHARMSLEQMDRMKEMSGYGDGLVAALNAVRDAVTLKDAVESVRLLLAGHIAASKDLLAATDDE